MKVIELEERVVQKVKAYETIDGYRFKTFEEAYKHEDVLNAINDIKALDKGSVDGSECNSAIFYTGYDDTLYSINISSAEILNKLIKYDKYFEKFKVGDIALMAINCEDWRNPYVVGTIDDMKSKLKFLLAKLETI